ncbi:phage tail sheath C-terminal domain-containing protein [Pseudactinotalea sp. Z1739]|uniref:phage tail sheath family protein n=1 Tax=Pseudactinotalea sp. Z1739 TaxID=3413028 RepID=UPI003C7B526F
MPATLTYPGVYIQEIPSGSRTITGVATAVAAFVGSARRGPVDRPIAITSYAEFERTFGGLSRDSGLGYAVRDYYLNGGSQAVIVRLAGGARPATVDVDGAVTLEALGPGTWGNRLEVEVQHAVNASAEDAALVAADQGVAVEDLFHLTVREGDVTSPRLVETYLNVTLADGPRRLDTALQSSQLIRIQPGLTLPADVVPSERHRDQDPAAFYAAGESGGGTDGTDSNALSLQDYIGGDGDSFVADKLGLYALVDADLFTILCLPPSRPDGETPPALWSPALQLCVEERAMLIVDPPPGSTVADIRDWIDARNLTANGRNGVLYFPRIRRADPLRNGAIGTFVPSGAVAGVMARTDGARGVWKAPAGLEAGLVGANGLAGVLTDGENGRLNPHGVNCLRTFRGVGSVVWGARTLRGADLLADEYKYVPVRRLALFLEETLYRNTQWVVFEPNDEPLWSQIRASIGAFLQDLFRQGAFQGTTPRDAYFVRCNSETTTQYDIDRGIVNIVVGFAPLKPAEFVVVSIQQKTAAAQT